MGPSFTELYRLSTSVGVLCYMYYVFLHVAIIQCVFVAVTGSLVLYMCLLEAKYVFSPGQKGSCTIECSLPNERSQVNSGKHV